MNIIHLSIVDGQGPVWPELSERAAKGEVIHLAGGEWHVAALRDGTVAGNPSIALRIDLPDGKVLVTEQTASTFVTIAKAIEAAFPEMVPGNVIIKVDPTKE